MSMLRAEEQLGQLSQTLWHQRRLVELLLYRLETQQLVLAANRTRWVDQASRDVEDAITALRNEELLRATQVAAVAPSLGVAADASLSELAAAAGEPWRQILRDHQTSFLTLIASIESVSRDNRELLAQGLEDTRNFMARITKTPSLDGYSPEGTGTRATAAPTMVDWDV